MTRYLLDANTFIQAKNLHYGFDFCPAFWDWLITNNAAQNVASIKKVGDELIAGDDHLADWARMRGDSFFIPPDDPVVPALAAVATKVNGQNYESAAISLFLQSADYWLIAHALAHDFTVVTHEKPGNGSVKKIKIPDVCVSLGINVVNTFEMLRGERARFVLSR